MSLTPSSQSSPEMMSTPDSTQSLYRPSGMVDPQMYQSDDYNSSPNFTYHNKVPEYKNSEFTPAHLSYDKTPTAAQIYGVVPRSTYNYPVNTAPCEPLNMYYDYKAHTVHGNQGPPFRETVIERPLIAAGSGVKLDISARATRNFFPLGDKWGCYRRNYISLSCSFSVTPMPYGSDFYVNDDDGNTARIRSFAFGISGIVNDSDDDIRELVMHGPKRDKASERKPPKVLIRPSPAGIMSTHFPGHPQHGMTRMEEMDYLAPYGVEEPSQLPHNHTFERIQFVKATANNGKRRATQQYYNLVVTLYADVSLKGAPNWIAIAKRKSEPIIVRGRSPSHYNDSKKHATQESTRTAAVPRTHEISEMTHPSVVHSNMMFSQPRTTFDSMGAIPPYFPRDESRNIYHSDLQQVSPIDSPFGTPISTPPEASKRRTSVNLLPSDRLPPFTHYTSRHDHSCRPPFASLPTPPGA
ncbi:hypothetical protein KEM54_001694 [Ascosphaera aggregata]|nr:hypothetical protein KEM54_001694 [Ascosphaera aggregata]